MSFFKYIFALLLFIGIAGCQNRTSDSDIEISKPNILFIAVDDMNDWVGALGDEHAKTPNIDRLASRGILFTNAHAAAPICNPSRTSVMTGLRPSTSGVYHNDKHFRETVPNVETLSQFFQEQGYTVHGGGKIYHDPPPFNYDSLSFESYFWWNEHKEKGAFDGKRWRSPYSVPPDPELPGRPVNKITPITKRNFTWGAIDQPEDNWPDKMVTDWASDFLDTDHQDPFFLAVGIFRPHVPWFNPSKYVDEFPLENIELPEVLEDDLSDLGVMAKGLALTGASNHEKLKEFGEWEEAVQAYRASIHFSDKSVGRVLDALNESKYKDNTIVVFWSDHGYHLGEKAHWHKRTLWERSTHVPLIIYVPDLASGKVDAPVSLLDLYPTLVDLIGLEKPDHLDGISLTPLLEDQDSNWPHAAVSTHGENNHAVRSRNWRYIRYNSGEEELYDHRVDSNEWYNLAGKSEFDSIKINLRKYMPK